MVLCRKMSQYTDAVNDLVVCHIIGEHRLRTQDPRTVEQTVQCVKRRMGSTHRTTMVSSVSRRPSLIAMIETAAIDQATISINTAMIQWYAAMVQDAAQPVPQCLHSLYSKPLKHSELRVQVRITGDQSELVTWLHNYTTPQYATRVSALLAQPHTTVKDWLALEGDTPAYRYHCQYQTQGTTHVASGYLAMQSLVQDSVMYYYPVWVNHTL